METIQSAAKRGNVDVVRNLLSSGTSVNSQDDYGETALHECARYGHDNIAELLLTNGANVSIKAQKNNGWEPLHIAGHYGKIGVATQLLAMGATINSKDDRGDTALTLATRNKKGDMIRFLISRGADPNIPGKNGQTANQIASQSSHAAMKPFLAGGSTPSSFPSSSTAAASSAVVSGSADVFSQQFKSFVGLKFDSSASSSVSLSGL